VEEPSESPPEPGEEEAAQELMASDPSPSESDAEDGGRQGGFVVGVETSFRGPLPPPAMLNDYNAVLPGLADRIVQMAEKEQSQDHRMQRWYAILRFTGQGAAFLLALAGLVIGGLLINAGHKIEGLVALVGGLVPVVSAFLYRQIKGNGA
jgi:uncharacterized membrane protein